MGSAALVSYGSHSHVRSCHCCLSVAFGDCDCDCDCDSLKLAAEEVTDKGRRRGCVAGSEWSTRRIMREEKVDGSIM